MDMPKIGEYTIIKTLGNGKFGIVYLVESIVDKQLFAIKIIKATEDNQNYVKKQASRHASLEHPNIVQVHGFFYYQGKQNLAIVLDYCQDGTLASFIEKNKFGPQECKRVINQIAEGLAYIHKNNILHRNIKTQNILLMKRVVKICNFGFAKNLTLEDIFSSKGSLYYQAPEVLDKQNHYEAKSDVYSFGIVILELALGKRIFKIIEGWEPPGRREGFPSQDILNEIGDKELRELVRLMLKQKAQERLNVSQVQDFIKSKRLKQEYEQLHKQEKNRKQTNKINTLAKELEQEKKETYNSKRVTKELERGNKQTDNNNTYTNISSNSSNTLINKSQQENKQTSNNQTLLNKLFSYSGVYNTKTSNTQTINQLQQMQYQQQLSTQNQLYRFSLQHKQQQFIQFLVKSISIKNNFTKAIINYYGSYDGLALVDGVIFQNGSSITFTITSINYGAVAVGLGILNLIVKQKYDIPYLFEIGHGFFLLTDRGKSYSHSNKEDNNVGTDFKYKQGDVIKVERNGDELWWRNEITKKEFRMKVKLTPDEWVQACFCVYLAYKDSSVQINVGSSPSNKKSSKLWNDNAEIEWWQMDE